MPYPNEHACRLLPPTKGADTGRSTREHDGKTYSIINQQQTDGKWKEQAFRYSKQIWTADTARNHCKNHGGSFEAAISKETLETLPIETIVVKDFISLIGSLAKGDKEESDIDIHVRSKLMKAGLFLEEATILLPLRKVFDPDGEGILHRVYDPQGTFAEGIPMYDLILRRNGDIDRIAVKEGDNSRLAFFKKDSAKQIVYGIVFEPDFVDTQGEWMTKDDIEEAAHMYLIQSRRTKMSHKKDISGDVDVVESYCAPVDFKYGDALIKEGTWILAIKVRNPKIWKDVESGKIVGYSAGGAKIFP